MKALSESGLSQRAACRLVGCPRPTVQYRARRKPDDPVLIEAMNAVAAERPRFGRRRLRILVLRKGFRVSERRFVRIYRTLALQVRHLRKRHIRYVRGTRGPMATHRNEGWSLDFLHDALLNRRWFRALNLMDDCTREQLALEPDFSFPSGQVIRVLDGVAFERGSYPKVLRVDQGPELTSLAMLRWAAEHDVILQFSDPGKPTQNAHVESLNGRVRDELFNLHCFQNLNEVREATAAWRHDYNHVRPHSALGNMTPAAFAESVQNDATLQFRVA